MNESQLMKVSVIGALLGIAALFVVTSLLTVSHVNIGEVDRGMIGSIVNVSGEVKKLFTHKDGHLFFQLNDISGEIKIVIWDRTVKQLKGSGIRISNLRDGDMVEIVGSVEIYEGELEIIPIRNQVRFI